jgi:hypothetical protein
VPAKRSTSGLIFPFQLIAFWHPASGPLSMKASLPLIVAPAHVPVSVRLPLAGLVREAVLRGQGDLELVYAGDRRSLVAGNEQFGVGAAKLAKLT